MRIRYRTKEEIPTPEGTIPEGETADVFLDDGGPMVSVDFWDYGIEGLDVPRETIESVRSAVYGWVYCRSPQDTYR